MPETSPPAGPASTDKADSTDEDPSTMPAARPLDRIILVAVVVTVVLVAVTLAVVALTGRGKEAAAPPAPGNVTTTATSVAPSGDPDLIGFDDFSGTKPDAKWGLYDSVSPIGATWTPAMDQVSDGNLRIVGTGSNPTGLGNKSGGLCWCGTGGNRLYGRWEVRAKFDAGAGYGQTIGLWPESDQAADGSIGIAETLEPAKNSLHTYVVWAADGHRHNDETASNGDYTTWHTYSVEWRSSFVRIMADGRVVYDSTTSKQKVVIPTKPMHLYLQQTVGPRDGVPAANPQTPAQVNMTIDWVRLYR